MSMEIEKNINIQKTSFHNNLEDYIILCIFILREGMRKYLQQCANTFNEIL